MATANDLQAAVFRTSGIEPQQAPLRVGRGDINGARKNIIDSLAVSAVGSELLPPVIEVISPGVYEPFADDVEFQGVGAESPNPSTIEASHSIWRFQVAVNINRLVHIQCAIGSPPQSVQQVMGIFATEPG